jgi:hypothetical protein
MKAKLEIIKMPLENHPKDIPQQFPKMPRLYLELIENKAKIQQSLINTEYVHKYESREDTPPRMEPVSPGSDDDDDESEYSRSINDDRSEESIVSIQQKDDDDVSSIGSRSPGEDDNQSISKRLTELLGDDSDHESMVSRKQEGYKKRDKYSVQRDKRGHSITKHGNAAAPSFAELEAQGAYVPRKELNDIGSIPEADKNQDDVKRELLFKFELLRKSYPQATIPEYSIHTEYKVMLSSYEDCVRRLSLDSSVESYKQYLIYAFMGLEFLLGKFMKLDMEGFTQQQILSMSSYEKLLIELGEKSYVPEGSEWSVEVRLLGLVLMNTAFFVVSKMIMAKTSVNLMNMMNGMTDSFKPKTDGVSSDGNAPKRKMRGPDIDLDSI